MKFERVEYKGWADCLLVGDEEAEIVVCVGLGPRVLRFGRPGGVNFLKNFDEQMAAPSDREWLSYGGHRLWHAPEVFPRTYYPDVDPVEYDWDGRCLRLRCAVEKTTGLQKEIDLAPLPGEGGVELRHRVYNRNPWAVAFAPWALTVMAPGGRAIIPQEHFVPHGPGKGETFEPARPLVLWPFTNMADPRLRWGERFIEMRQDDAFDSKIKFGMLNKRGWAAYALDGELFVKRFAHVEGATYPDMGCNAEFFTMPGFLEIESLGPLAAVAPGGCAELGEHWSLRPDAPPAGDEEAMAARFAELFLA